MYEKGMKLVVPANRLPAIKNQVTATLVRADGTRLVEEQRDTLVEHHMELIVNEKQQHELEHTFEHKFVHNFVHNFVCSPTELLELCIGYLKSSLWIEDVNQVESVVLSQTGDRAEVILREKSTRKEPGRLPQVQWRQDWVFALIQAFQSGSKLHTTTKGTHSCYLSVNGNVSYQAEDIGRYNALDKVIGHMVYKGYSPKECMLYISGRVPSDMVYKAIAAGVPILVSKAVPTDAALVLARQYGLTLICKAWPDSFVVYK